MTSDEKIRDLKAIATAWMDPKLHAFEQVWVAERAASWTRGHGGGTGEIRAASRVTRDHVAQTLSAFWNEMLPYLERTHLAWDADALLSLAMMIDEVAQGAVDSLLKPIERITTHAGDTFLPAERGVLQDLMRQQRAAIAAKLRIYVADRRRREIIDALLEAEALAMAADMAEALQAVREAKREAEKPAPDDGRLKRLLDTVIRVKDATGATLELQTRLQDLLTWLT